jgi:hypothetical protein
MVFFWRANLTIRSERLALRFYRKTEERGCCRHKTDHTPDILKLFLMVDKRKRKFYTYGLPKF